MVSRSTPALGLLIPRVPAPRSAGSWSQPGAWGGFGSSEQGSEGPARDLIF